MSDNLFIGRKNELSELESLQKKKTASLVVIKGRRRVGKSRLIDEFTKTKNVMRFRGLAPNEQTTAQEQRDTFTRQFSQVTNFPEVSLDDWSKCFELLAREVKDKQTIVVMDEISWMGSKDSSFTSKLKDAWDEHFKKNSKLMLILCGSISIWIEEHIINSTEFYGRISWSIDLQPLSLSESNAMLVAQGFKTSHFEKLKLLSVTGGIPWYIEQMQAEFSAAENIKRQCFNTGGTLLNEFDRIFKEMFDKKDVIYKKIVTALASGALEYDDIASKIEYQSSGRLSQHLENMIKAGFIKREYNWSLKTGKQSSTSKFRLSDNYLRFYLKYIENRRAQIEKGNYIDIPLASLPGWDSLMGLQFENLLINNRNQLLELLNIPTHDVVYDNPYFQKATKNRKGCQIDYLIQTRTKVLYLFEIKFSSNPVAFTVIEEVQEKIKRITIPKGFAIVPILIHVNGVSEKIAASDFFLEIIDFGRFLND